MAHSLADLQNFFPDTLRQANWNIDHETGMWLAKFVQEHSLTRLLELGTSIGVSTSYLALATAGTVMTIESNPSRHHSAKEYFAGLGLINITALLDHAPECFDSLPTDYDCVFIDCIKLYYKDFTEYSINHFPKLRYIILDNTMSHREELESFFEFLKDKNYEEIQIGSGLITIIL